MCVWVVARLSQSFFKKFLHSGFPFGDPLLEIVFKKTLILVYENLILLQLSYIYQDAFPDHALFIFLHKIHKRNLCKYLYVGRT